ncbi:hypothetical protein [Pseudidiomarina terrestris]|uniref:Amino acid ABC transporter substrate-binding protein n=1 Tax=Pseudidiomarina terrestris TaxID=2820060 RepID=A0ABT8MHP6_9GAMM|nr:MULTISPECIES: hypothetical protein [unclassified Pseudidiomarina]MDN7129460.1 hypothetical protein [Pseudidiomarina sp. 1APR75-15]MDN7134275.1 hypothetical protein [Pseudidiomarina sp. 1ASP75-5]MEA3587931.1 hypothetical protein [Pseudidiomarina sp. 1APP75-27a]
MRQFTLLFVFIVAAAFAPVQAAKPQAAEQIVVAAYDFPPYFSAYSDTHLVGDLLEALNSRQSDYFFVLEDIPSKARFRALSEAGCCDMILFESPAWGWPQQFPGIRAGRVLVQGAERFVALQKEDRGQSFFAQPGLRFGGLTGYHYPFLNNQTDQAVLEDHYNVYLSLSHRVNIKMLLNGRLDVVMLHDEYLHQLRHEPWFDDLLLKREPYDTYELRTLVNPAKGFSLEEWQQVLQPLIEDGSLANLLADYDLPWPPARVNVLIDTKT